MAELFKQALDEDRPSFIDFFLRINYDPRLITSTERINSAAIETDAEAVDMPSRSKSREVITNYQNQVDLGEKGLDFVLQLYREAQGLSATVSSNRSQSSYSYLTFTY